MNIHTKIDPDEIADQLMRAATERCQLAPLSSTWPEMTASDAYAIQLSMVQRRVNSGERVAGKKIGLTSLPIQQMLGVFEPDYGHLFESMCIANGGQASMNTLIQPKIEAEIAFVLKNDLSGPHVSTKDVFDATDYIVPALEIIDSRIRNWDIKLQDTVADNGSSAMYVLGDNRSKPGSFSLGSIEMVLKKNGETSITGSGSAVMGNPAIAVAWLANKLSEFGVNLSAGEVVLSGSFGKAIDVRAGDSIEADFGDMGTVSVRFL